MKPTIRTRLFQIDLKNKKPEKPMKPRNSRILITTASAMLLISTAFADDGTWNVTTTPASWDTATNWLDNTIANGAGFTANFSTLDITANTTVTLDSDRTIGNLIFGDTNTSSAAGWILAGQGEEPTEILTLDGPSPTITVNALAGGRNASITATLAGSSGFTKDGAGVLVLNNITNTISGPVVLSAGNLNIQSRPLTNATSVTINGGLLISATAGSEPLGDAVISFGGGSLQYNTDPTSDYSSQFSTADNQQYRIVVTTASGVDRIAKFSSNLSSQGGTLTKVGTGVLILDAANTFNGSTTILAGTLQLDNPLALQNSPLNTTSSIVGTSIAGIILNDVTSPTFGGLTGNKALASLFNTDIGNYDQVTNVTLNPGADVSHTYSASIAEGAPGMTLTKSGPGTQILTVANSHSGGTIISGGILNYGVLGALSSGPISFTGNGTLQAGVAANISLPISIDSGATGTFHNGGFATTISAAITGDGAFAKTGAGALTLTGGEDNTFAGGFDILTGRVNVTDGLSLTNTTGPITIASGGTLNYSKNFENGNDLENPITISGPGTTGMGALNLQGNATATGPITLADDATISHNFNNATISGSITGTNRNLILSTLTDNQNGMTVSGPITLGTGGITVQGAANSGNFSIRLTGNNSYTGETHVVSGVLMLSGDARINDFATVRIDAGAVLHLDFAGTDLVSGLVLGGISQLDGTYGAIGSGAANESAFFEGTGIIEVGTPADGFASWAAANGIPGELFNDDFSGDGISNGMAYALGLNPTESSHPVGVLSENTITFTKGTDAIANADVSWTIQVSETLDAESWSDEVTQAAGNATPTISFDLDPTPGTPKKFARLKVVQVP